MDNIKNNIYPMPILCEGNDNVFVGRIRRDMSKTKSINMWIVSDNLRKGSATNAVQILEYLINNNFVFKYEKKNCYSRYKRLFS